MGDPGSTPGSGRSPGEGNGNLLQYSCLGDPMDRGAWHAAVHGVTKELDLTSCSFNKSSLTLDFGSHGLLHTRLPCPSLSPRVCSNSFISIELMMPSNHLILCRPLLLRSIFPNIKVFSSELTLYQVAKVLELQLQHQFFHEYSWLISFWIDWFDLFTVQGTLKRPLVT